MVHMEFIHMKQKNIYILNLRTNNNIKKDKKIIGIGESGLDFYYNHSEKSDQIFCF